MQNHRLKNIKKILQQYDTVLVKGSHGMKLIDVVNYLKKIVFGGYYSNTLNPSSKPLGSKKPKTASNSLRF